MLVLKIKAQNTLFSTFLKKSQLWTAISAKRLGFKKNPLAYLIF
jgi:hypothetical protein